MATIIISNPNQDSHINLHEFEYEHESCPSGRGAMRWFRGQINDIVTLKCSCGIEISFPQIGSAASAIAKTSIDGSQREISGDSFSCTPQQSLIVRSITG